MSNKDNKIMKFGSDVALASFLNERYLVQIKNFFADEKKALKFLSSVRSDIQRNPKLLECEPMTIVNSYMTMAQLGFLPSSVSGEAYVLPYNNSKKEGDSWVKVLEAQFQMGYQGFVTLFYQAGIEKITSEIVRKNDKFSLVNGELRHEIDLTLSNKERGEAIGAYVKIVFRGVENMRYMNAKDILEHAQKFSKSYDATGKYSPWNPANDPELNMWRKTVLKQMAKYLPKNEIINKAIELDNRDSIIADRLDSAINESQGLKMGNLLNTNEKNNAKKESIGKEENKDEVPSSESDEVNPFAKG